MTKNKTTSAPPLRKPKTTAMERAGNKRRKPTTAHAATPPRRAVREKLSSSPSHELFDHIAEWFRGVNRANAWEMLFPLLHYAVEAAELLPAEVATEEDRMGVIAILQALYEVAPMREAGELFRGNLQGLLGYRHGALVLIAQAYRRDQGDGGGVGQPARDYVREVLLHHAQVWLVPGVLNRMFADAEKTNNGATQPSVDGGVVYGRVAHGLMTRFFEARLVPGIGDSQPGALAAMERECSNASRRHDWGPITLVRAALRGWGLSDSRVKSLTKRLSL